MNNNEELRNELTEEVAENPDCQEVEEEHTHFICDGCGEDYEDYDEDRIYNTGDGYRVCENCIENDYYCCEDCGEYYNNDDMTLVHDSRGDRYVCNDCLDDYSQCDDCGEYYNSDDMTWGDDHCYCENCFEDNLAYCDRCEEYHNANDVEYVDELDQYLCGSCREEYDNESDIQHKIYGYHCFNKWVPKKSDSEEVAPFYIGHELEIEHVDDSNEHQQEAIDIAVDELDCVCMHDGSLHCSGIETISHPMSYKYRLEHKDEYKKAFEELINLGYRSHETKTCGLHFHVSRPSDEVIERIWFIMETYKDQLITFSRRKSEEISHWAQFMSDVRMDEDDKHIKSLEFYKKNKNYTTSTRYMALNNTNDKTIEFRLFKGTLNFDTFMASLELVNNLVSLCSDMSINVEDITWTRLTSTEYAKKYVEERGILTDMAPKDYTLELVELENRQHAIMNNCNKILMSYSRRLYNELKLDKSSAKGINELYSRLYDFKYGMASRTLEVLDVFISISQETSYKHYKTRLCRAFVDYHLDTEVYNKLNELLNTME